MVDRMIPSRRALHVRRMRRLWNAGSVAAFWLAVTVIIVGSAFGAAHWIIAIRDWLGQ